jgi:hypothetical protein
MRKTNTRRRKVRINERKWHKMKGSKKAQPPLSASCTDMQTAVGGPRPRGLSDGLYLQVEGKSPASAMMNQRSVVTIGINAPAELRPELR